MSEKIAVIMAVYNEKKEWVAECVESIIGQTYEKIHLYILLDNPENKDLLKLLNEYGKKDSRITFLQNEKNLGLVASLNKLLGMVTEKYIARMDADDVCMLDRLEKEMYFLHENDLDFVMSDCSFLYEDGKTGNGQALPVLKNEIFNQVQAYGNVSLHNTWLLKKEIYDSLEGYRDVKYCEDYDFTLRAVQKGYKIGRMSEELVIYRRREGSISFLNAKEQFEKAGLLRYMYRKGKPVSDISSDKLNEKFSCYDIKVKEEFAEAKTKIDLFAGCLYDGKYGKAMLQALDIIFSGREGRRLFANLFWGRCKLSAIYKKPEFK